MRLLSFHFLYTSHVKLILTDWMITDCKAKGNVQERQTGILPCLLFLYFISQEEKDEQGVFICCMIYFSFTFPPQKCPKLNSSFSNRKILVTFIELITLDTLA